VGDKSKEPGQVDAHDRDVSPVRPQEANTHHTFYVNDFSVRAIAHPDPAGRTCQGKDICQRVIVNADEGGESEREGETTRAVEQGGKRNRSAVRPILLYTAKPNKMDRRSPHIPYVTDPPIWAHVGLFRAPLGSFAFFCYLFFDI
jgi:hypothetical protein